jgi:hypothetical protein
MIGIPAPATISAPLYAPSPAIREAARRAVASRDDSRHRAATTPMTRLVYEVVDGS